MPTACAQAPGRYRAARRPWGVAGTAASSLCNMSHCCLQHDAEATEEAKWLERLSLRRRWGREAHWGLPLTPSAGRAGTANQRAPMGSALPRAFEATQREASQAAGRFRWIIIGHSNCPGHTVPIILSMLHLGCLLAACAAEVAPETPPMESIAIHDLRDAFNRHARDRVRLLTVLSPT